MAFSTVEVYDPSTDKWMERADMPTARMYISTSAVGGKLYAIDGIAGDEHYTTVEEYAPGPFAVPAQGKLATTWGSVKHSW